MKHDQLCAIAHNLVDSMASGLGFVIGYYPVDVFGEAAESDGGTISIDFWSGKIMSGQTSTLLARAASLYAEALPDFCQKHGAAIDEFSELSASFIAGRLLRRVVLNVTDKAGHRSQTEYVGVPLKRVRVLDSQGRIRRTRRKFARSER